MLGKFPQLIAGIVDFSNRIYKIVWKGMKFNFHAFFIYDRILIVNSVLLFFKTNSII